MTKIVYCLLNRSYSLRKSTKEVMYSGNSLLRSPTGLGESDLNIEVCGWVICTVGYNLGLSQDDCNGGGFLLVR